MVAAAETNATAAAVAFARYLRAEGLDVPIGATLTFVQALDLVGLADRDAVYWAGRATLVTRPEAVEVLVHRLRRRIESGKVRITTLRGLGYVLEAS